MPTGAPHPCPHPGCPALVPMGQARCEKHSHDAQVADRERRGTAAERGYGSRWQRARVVFLAANPLCAVCGRKSPPRITPATVVDHITDHKGDPVLFWDERNWQPSCEACHNERVDAGDFGRT